VIDGALCAAGAIAATTVYIYTRDRTLMADMVNRRLTSALMLVRTIVITGLNVSLLSEMIGNL
jgi:Mn2+/Fe2+ NRAMP family transporter